MSTKPKILVVEWDEGERTLLLRVLSRDYDATGASSAEEALRVLAHSPCQLVLLGGTGRPEPAPDLLEGLASGSDRPKLILFTPSFCEEVLRRANAVAADGVLDSRDEGEIAACVAAHLRS